MFFRCVLILNLVFVTVGSLYTNLAAKKVAIEVKKVSADLANKTTGNNHHNNSSSNNVKCANINVDNAALFNQSNKAKIATSFLERFFSCFCVVKNSEIITTEYLGSDSIEVIHGMR